MSPSNSTFPGEVSSNITHADEVAAALVEDAKVAAILRDARARNTAVPVATEQSLNESALFMEQMRRGDVSALMEKIARKELLLEDELRKIMGVHRKWILEALNDNRLFFLRTPSDETYYPAFFGNPAYDRQMLESVCQNLGELPGPSKLHFFTSKSTFLGRKTPLQALADGRSAEVLIAAEGFLQR